MSAFFEIRVVVDMSNTLFLGSGCDEFAKHDECLDRSPAKYSFGAVELIYTGNASRYTKVR